MEASLKLLEEMVHSFELLGRTRWSRIDARWYARRYRQRLNGLLHRQQQQQYAMKRALRLMNPTQRKIFRETI